MEFYNTEDGVAQYLEMADGYDGAELIAKLHDHLDSAATILELGMGPGKDLDLLREHYQATGSDYSEVFLSRYRALHPDADILQLDAVTLDTERRFDAVYSNKVLHHLDDDALAASVDRQRSVLNANGLAIHSFWHGDTVETFSGMTFHYRNEQYLERIFGKHFDIVLLDRYAEMEDDDSLLIIAKLK